MKLLEDFNALVDKISPDKPMSEEETKTFIGLSMSQHEQVKEIAHSDHPDLAKMVGVRIFLKRIESLSTIQFNFGTALMLGTIISNPGEAVVYAYYCHRKLPPETIVTFDNFARELFPWGMLSSDQMEEIWMAQKINGEKALKQAKKLKQYGGADNLLDYELTWKKNQ